MCITFTVISVVVVISLGVILAGIIMKGYDYVDIFIPYIAILILFSMITFPFGVPDTCKTKETILNQPQIQSSYSNEFATVRINTEYGEKFLNFTDASDINKIKLGTFSVQEQVRYNHYGYVINKVYYLKKD